MARSVVFLLVPVGSSGSVVVVTGTVEQQGFSSFSSLCEHVKLTDENARLLPP